MFMDPHLPQGRVDRHALGVALSVGKGRRQRIVTADERVILGNRAIRVESQDRAIVVGQVLRRLVLSPVADTDIQLSIGSESQPRSEMPAARRAVLRNENRARDTAVATPSGSGFA